MEFVSPAFRNQDKAIVLNLFWLLCHHCYFIFLRPPKYSDKSKLWVSSITCRCKQQCTAIFANFINGRPVLSFSAKNLSFDRIDEGGWSRFNKLPTTTRIIYNHTLGAVLAGILNYTCEFWIDGDTDCCKLLSLHDNQPATNFILPDIPEDYNIVNINNSALERLNESCVVINYFKSDRLNCPIYKTELDYVKELPNLLQGQSSYFMVDFSKGQILRYFPNDLQGVSPFNCEQYCSPTFSIGSNELNNMLYGQPIFYNNNNTHVNDNCLVQSAPQTVNNNNVQQQNSIDSYTVDKRRAIDSNIDIPSSKKRRDHLISKLKLLKGPSKKVPDLKDEFESVLKAYNNVSSLREKINGVILVDNQHTDCELVSDLALQYDDASYQLDVLVKKLKEKKKALQISTSMEYLQTIMNSQIPHDLNIL